MTALPTKKINANLFFFSGVFVLFTLIAFYYGIKRSIYYSYEGIPTYWFHLSYHYLASGWTWTLLMPLLLSFVKTLQGRKFFIPTIIILALPVAMIHRSIALLSDCTFRWYMGYTDLNPMNGLFDMKQFWVTGIFDSVLAYFVILLMIVIYYGRYGKLMNRESTKQRAKLMNENPAPALTYNPERDREHLVVKKNGKWIFIKTCDINWFKSEGNYQKIFYQDDWVMIRKTMTDIQQKLHVNKFFRINRSTIININFIKEFEPWFNGEYKVTLLDGSSINTSKTYRTEVNRLLQTNG